MVYETGQFDQFTLLTADEDTLSGHPADISVFVLEMEDYCVLFVAKETERQWDLVGYTRNALYPGTKQNKTLQIQKIDSERFKMSWPGEQYGGTDHFTRLYEQRFMLMVNIALPLEKRMPRDCDSILLMIPLIGT